MINAVKADGKIDEAEAEKLTARLKDEWLRPNEFGPTTVIY
jgi:uncharacterized membrane protein YebE (DUF533 family)